MTLMKRTHRNAKIYYRPIEAAIRWSGLIRSEQTILDTAGLIGIPVPEDLSEWPTLRFNLERIYDAIVNGELPYGREGVTVHDGTSVEDQALTVRHVDLKAWMASYWPGQKPAFLFDALERKLHAAINVETVQALLTERDTLKAALDDRTRDVEGLHAQFQSLQHEHQALCASVAVAQTPGERSETTYLHITGGMLTLLLGQSQNGTPYSRFRSQEAVIEALIAHYPQHHGISERTLRAKFAQAKRQLASA